MKLISYASGRVRVEVSCLKNNPLLFEKLAAQLREIDGVHRVDFNFRTGRMLIRYDESIVVLEELIGAQPSCDLKQLDKYPVQKKSKVADFIRHLVADIAADLLLPKPLGLVLPIALKAIRV